MQAPQATLDRIIELRFAGQEWKQIEHELGLKTIEISPFRWWRAAILRSEHPELSWDSIGADPAVSMRRDTLIKDHKTKQLPNGMSFVEFITTWTTAFRERTEELVRSHAQEVADLLQEIGLEGLREIRELQRATKDIRELPPEFVDLRQVARGWESRPVAHKAFSQTEIVFVGEGGFIHDVAPRATPATLAFCAQMKRTLARAALSYKHLLQDISAGEIEEDSEELKLEALRETRGQARELLTEARQYLKERRPASA